MKTKTLWTLLLAVALCVVSATAWAGATYGPQEDYSRVAAYGSVQYRAITFTAGQRAIVAVTGDGDTVLRLEVRDQNNNLIDSDQCQHARCVATWVPNWTGSFYVTIRNQGSVYNEYSLETN